ncbi:hypothetical protein [Micromonospora echinofusca]|uniref:hypothetical protein n=1 Tax=Micromonospora echinofusca TaxID=47858 RepID=UPI0033CF3BA8
MSTVTPLDYDRDLPEAFTVLLDRPLTEDEQAALTALTGARSEVWEFLKPLGGRMVEHASYVAPFEDGNENRGHAQTFDLNLNSDRAAGLTINDMAAVKDSCRAPTAQTVVTLPPAGAESRQGLLWDLTGGPTDKPHGPYVLAEGEPEEGQLYFRRNVVELGNGQSKAFRIQPEVSTHTCEWHIVASYTDTTGSHEQRIPSGAGTFTTEAIPSRPVQYFERPPRARSGAASARCASGIARPAHPYGSRGHRSTGRSRAEPRLLVPAGAGNDRRSRAEAARSRGRQRDRGLRLRVGESGESGAVPESAVSPSPDASVTRASVWRSSASVVPRSW